MERDAPPASRTILLVDDDPVTLEILSILLGADGHRVLRAGTGQQALTLLSAASGANSDSVTPDLVFLDLQMPGLSGRELARSIRSIFSRRGDSHPIRLLAMSASAPAKAVDADFDAFLLKPITSDSLAAALTALSPSLPAAPAPRPNGVLDRRVIDKLRAILPPDAIREIYLTYISDTRMRIAELERCAGLRDVDGLRRCAHMIKGAAAMAGVSGIATIASALEAGAVPEENHGSLFHSLRAACDDVEQTLIRHVRL
jgi:CheY-like chemotaxis protein/HPt (histidine-containing phosphotransfer) domain-containing protein